MGDITTDATSARGAQASGRFIVRLDPELHAALRAEAAARGISLNALCAGALAERNVDERDGGGRDGEGRNGGFDPVVQAAIAAFGPELVGVVAFGSWARGEAVEGSDVDVLLVVAPEVAVTRELYRRWDRAPMTSMTVDGRAVDPHIVALPDGEVPVSSLWAEVARDGIIVFERAHRLSRHLGAVRRQPLSGQQRRVTAHGQPYWSTSPQEVGR